MKTWMKLLVVVSVLTLSAADEVKPSACDIDDPSISTERSYEEALRKFVPCFKNAITAEQVGEMEQAKSLAEFRTFTRAFCEHSSQVLACLAEVRASFERCTNKEVVITAMILGEAVEHLLPGVCENEGERLSYLLNGAILAAKNKTLTALKKCVLKATSLLDAGSASDLDLASETYIMHKEVPRYKKCLKHVDDQAYKTVVEWFLDEFASALKCKHPEEDKIVPCAEVDVSKVPVTNICDTKVLHHTNLYDRLENGTMHCFTQFVSLDTHENSNTDDLEILKETYKNICTGHKNMPRCLLQHSGFAEACLSQEEDKQFQLFAQSMEDFAERSCVEEGARMATVMHEVYQQTPEHGHALRDCFKAGEEARKSHHGHAVSSKNMRFYHEMMAFKQCVVDKLHDNNDVSKGMENMINDVLKKMKCVGPEDGTVVLCETIHEH